MDMVTNYSTGMVARYSMDMVARYSLDMGTRYSKDIGTNYSTSMVARYSMGMMARYSTGSVAPGCDTAPPKPNTSMVQKVWGRAAPRHHVLMVMYCPSDTPTLNVSTSTGRPKGGHGC
jgi:hypothetical protein